MSFSWKLLNILKLKMKFQLQKVKIVYMQPNVSGKKASKAGGSHAF